MTADGHEPDISAEALASHAREMMRQEWWGIFAAEASLPPCPICLWGPPSARPRWARGV
jgi:hypothetical protein